MWECMVLAFKVLVGCALWICVLGVVGGIVVGISMAWTKHNNPPEPPTKPKYKGQKIVIDGGKENE